MLHAKLLIPSRLCINLHISDPKRNFCLFLVLAPWRRSRGIPRLDTGAEQQQPGLGLLLPRAALHHSSPARNKVQVRTLQVRPWRQRALTF
jgi:hypothetical protein